MPNYAALKTELTSGANVATYAAIQGGLTNHNDLATMLNATTGALAGTVNPTAISKNAFLRATAAAAIRCKAGVGTDSQPFANPVVAVAWYEAVVQARSASGMIDLTLVSALEAICGGDPVTVKVMSQVEYTALTSRAGSRAEAIGFFDSLTDSPSTLSPDDIRIALKD